MVKGYQKKVVFLKNTGSEFFDEAYFVVCDTPHAHSEGDIISEANRIIDEIGGIETSSVGCKCKAAKILSFAAGSLLTVLGTLIYSVFF